MHRGGPWSRSGDAGASPDAQGEISLLVVGEPVPGGTSRRVAAELERQLAAERAAGRTAVLIWPGNNVFPRGIGPESPCVDEATAWSRKGVDALAEVARAHVQAGGHSFGVLGRRDWLCGQPESQLGEDPGHHPFAMPDHNYVVRIDAEGQPRIASRCDGATCTLPPPRTGDHLELVFLDLTPWIHHHELDPRARALGELVLARQTALLEALRVPSPGDPVRLLVTHTPVESAGMHGLGGARPTATFRRLPPAVRSALAEGRFRGVISAQDRSLQVTEDLSPAVARSAKVFVDRPFFQVVSGAASRPDARAVGSRRQISYFTGIAIDPDLYSTHAGFAVVRAANESIELELHARRGGRWIESRRELDRTVEPLPAERSAPAMAPCLQCDPVQGAADADKRRRTW